VFFRLFFGADVAASFKSSSSGSTNRLAESVTSWMCVLASSVGWRVRPRMFDGRQNVYVQY
jgi:hypothetical protein